MSTDNNNSTTTATATVTPFLMFNGTHTQDFLDHCASIFDDVQLKSMNRYGADGPGPEGSVQVAECSIHGQTIRCSDSFVKHEFDFTASFSLFVDCSSMEQLDRYYKGLSTGDDKITVMMPLNNYGFSKQFAWISDRFGISWQLNLP